MFKVTDFGAVANSSGCEGAVQTILDSAEDGALVYFPASSFSGLSEYAITAPIIIRKSVTIFGANSSVRLKMLGNDSIFKIIPSKANISVTIRDFALISGTSAVYVYSENFALSTTSKLERLRCSKQTDAAIKMYALESSMDIEDLYIANSPTGVYVNGLSSNYQTFILENSKIENCSVGYWIERNSTSSFSGVISVENLSIVNCNTGSLYQNVPVNERTINFVGGNISNILSGTASILSGSGGGGAGVSSHGALTGLSNNDHKVYMHVSGTNAVAAHLVMNNFNIASVGTVNGLNLTTMNNTIDAHILDGNNPHATSINKLDPGTLAELNNKISDADVPNAALVVFTSSFNPFTGTIQSATASLQTATGTLFVASSSFAANNNTLFGASGTFASNDNILFAASASYRSELTTLTASVTDLSAQTTAIKLATGSLQSATASLQATTASLLAMSASFSVISASYMTVSASYNIVSASYIAVSASYDVLSSGYYPLSSSFQTISASYRSLSASFEKTSASWYAFSSTYIPFVSMSIAMGFSGTIGGNYYTMHAGQGRLSGSQRFTAVIVGTYGYVMELLTKRIFGAYNGLNNGGWSIHHNGVRPRYTFTSGSGLYMLENFVGLGWADKPLCSGKVFHLGYSFNGTSLYLYWQGEEAATLTPPLVNHFSPDIFAAPAIGIESGGGSWTSAFDGGFNGCLYASATALTARQMYEHYFSCSRIGHIISGSFGFTNMWTVQGETTAPASLQDRIGNLPFTLTGTLSMYQLTNPQWS